MKLVSQIKVGVLALALTVLAGIVYQKWFAQEYHSTVMCRSVTMGPTFFYIGEWVHHHGGRVELPTGSYYPGVNEFCEVLKHKGPMPPAAALDLVPPSQKESTQDERFL